MDNSYWSVCGSYILIIKGGRMKRSRIFKTFAYIYITIAIVKLLIAISGNGEYNNDVGIMAFMLLIYASILELKEEE